MDKGMPLLTEYQILYRKSEKAKKLVLTKNKRTCNMRDLRSAEQKGSIYIKDISQ